ncbi:hypothetical protein [Nostoc sp.]
MTLVRPWRLPLAEDSLTAVAHGGDPQERTASPKSKLRCQRTKGET